MSPGGGLTGQVRGVFSRETSCEGLRVPVPQLTKFSFLATVKTLFSLVILTGNVT